MRELGRFYEMLRRHGELDGVRLLSPQTVAAITARHRTGMHDETFGVVIDWGLGFIIDSAIYGRHSSPRTFGHGGARSSVGFHDPEADLVVTLVFNGMAERGRHYRRLAATCEAIYDDLGLADPGGGLDRPVPGGNLL
jgi:CubicO group peptidase (beta-lactamase class C family)